MPVQDLLPRMVPRAVKDGLRPLKRLADFQRLPAAAKAAVRRDREGLGAVADPGIEATIAAALDWLGQAQDNSATRDGGVARHYSLVSGWSASYPETTGYIVPTLIEQARLRNDPVLMERARRMLDWLVSIQFPDGGFQGGTIGQEPRVPVTFNTGQILLGLAAGVAEFGDAYRPAMTKAADWLAETQDEDGCWRRFPTPFARADDKSYETHVAWGLLEAARLDPSRNWGDAGLAQVRWAIGRQRPNGWMADCCLEEPHQPLTHTLGYALRGILEAWRFSRDPAFLDAGTRLAEGLLGCLDGRVSWTASRPAECRVAPGCRLGLPDRLRPDRPLLADAVPGHRRCAVAGGGAAGERFRPQDGRGGRAGMRRAAASKAASRWMAATAPSSI